MAKSFTKSLMIKAALMHDAPADTYKTPKLYPAVCQLQYELLLRESIERDCYSAVRQLLEFYEKYPIIPSSKNGTEKTSNERISKCLEKAAQKGSSKLIRLFLSKNFIITNPHSLDCQCSLCLDDRFGQSKMRIEKFKAMVNPIYIGLTSKDPFLRTFELHEVCSRHKSEEDFFENEYNDIINQCQRFSLGLLDNIENESEVECLMGQGQCNTINGSTDLRFIKCAMEFRQKEIISHPVSQHAVANLVSEGIPGWRTSGFLVRSGISTFFALIYPITAIATIFFPKTHLAKLAKIPLIKFINSAASFVTLLVLLAAETSREKGLRKGVAPNGVQILIIIWIISMILQELGQVKEVGFYNYIRSGWNLIDINMIFFLSLAYILWTISCFTNHRHKDRDNLLISNFADGLFACGLVISFFRLLYLCHITRFLSLLQLSFGKMLQAILQFAFISFIGLLSFSIGLVFLFNSSNHAEKKHHELTANKTFVSRILTSYFSEIPSAMVTLAWDSMSLGGLESLEQLEDGTLIHLWSFLLFTLFHAGSVIVLLNMLIALMSSSHQEIADNIEVEHKYARTDSWLEFVGDVRILPCPFNLIPRFSQCRKFVHKTSKKCFRNSFRFDEYCETVKRNRSAKEKYESLCKILVERYMIKNYGVGYFESTVEENASSDEDEILLAKVKKKIEKWSRFFEGEKDPNFDGRPASKYWQKVKEKAKTNYSFQSEEENTDNVHFEDIEI